jgi:hypothetical protein
VTNKITQGEFSVSPNKYKIKGKIPNDNKDQEIELTIEVAKKDEESFAVIFTKKQGDHWKFLEEIEKHFKEEIAKLN